MIILHTSDLHGNTARLFAQKNFDVWVDTGDFIPDFGPWTNPRAGLEGQRRWLHDIAEDVRSWLAGRPALCVSGNHDWVDIANVLPVVNVWRNPQTINGVRFAGFPHVPPIGWWNWEAEEPERRDEIAIAYATTPDVLLTHGPPDGILAMHYGCPLLRTTPKPPGLRYHLFGHIHECGGRILTQNGFTYSNAATMINVVPLVPAVPVAQR